MIEDVTSRGARQPCGLALATDELPSNLFPHDSSSTAAAGWCWMRNNRDYGHRMWGSEDCLAASEEWGKESVYATKGDDSVIWVGKVKRNVAPRPSLAAAHNRPPCDSTMERLIANSIPLPCVLVVKNAEKI